MMYHRYLAIAVTLATAAVCSASVIDNVHTFSPTPADLYDLPHERAYMWGIDTGLDSSEQVISATLSFYQIRNWDNSANDLYNSLLDGCALGVTQLSDNAGGDYFLNIYSGLQTSLVTYSNLTTAPVDLHYDFNADQLSALNGYLTDGVIGIGIDPDCHYYNCGIELTLTTPEPTAFTLLGLGLLAFFWRRR
ncbi:MAG: PEP-CTERM sorting domain-containing protein [Phycisphaerae bacterium]|nr:PEP-CTERM sorting domain-containing protein [Phycisphaerae bacterium]